jgi:hypothetical protein
MALCGLLPKNLPRVRVFWTGGGGGWGWGGKAFLQLVHAQIINDDITVSFMDLVQFFYAAYIVIRLNEK